MFTLLLLPLVFLYKLVIRILFLIMLIITMAFFFQIYIYLEYPEKIIPLYKKLNSTFHDEQVKHLLEIHTIFSDMVVLLPVEINNTLRLEIKRNDLINAWVGSDGQIVITVGMIEFMNYNKGEIALVLGHEIAHYVLNHHGYKHKFNSTLKSSAWKESTADMLGILLAKSAGYNACNGSEIWKRFMSQGGGRLYATSHPTPAYRMVLIDRLCEKII